ncbi:hypothetical protein BOX15_Mlig006462g2, partial [Macrostomum lignano]
TNIYSFDGVLVAMLLFICTCAYMKRVPKLKDWCFTDKSGIWGVLYKAAVIGIRLHVPVSVCCLLMAVYVIFLR